MQEEIERSWKRIGRIGTISNHGEAIRYIEYAPELNVWVAHCDEYATVIKYCPFCGEELGVADFYLK